MILDNSRLSAVATCETYTIMRYVWGWTNQTTTIEAAAGNCVHRAVESWFTHWNQDQALHAGLGRYQPEWVRSLEQPARLCPNNLKEILLEWMKVYQESRLPFGVVTEGIEQCLLVELMPGVRLSCKIDVPVRLRNGEICPLDVKTTGGMTSWWRRTFYSCSQLSLYAWALQQAFKQPVRDVRVLGFELKLLPQPTERKCREHGVAYRECRREHARFELFSISRTPAMLQEAVNQARVLAIDYQRLCDRFPVEGTEITQADTRGRFSGRCRFCEFEGWCAAGRYWPAVEGLFVKSPWEPWIGDNVWVVENLS